MSDIEFIINSKNKLLKFRGETLTFWIELFYSLKLDKKLKDILEKSQDYIEIENAVKNLQIEKFLSDEIIIEDFNNFYIDGKVKIGKNSVISSGVVIKGKSIIGKGVRIYPNVYIENGIIGDNVTILPGTVISDSRLEGNNKIGPYAHLRNGVMVKEDANIGNFVEMKKSVFGRGSKAMHLSYIGDSEVGEKVNIGAGTITCNYDGVNKNKTVIEDEVFVGSGTELIAPIIIGKGSFVAAGSTITSNIPENSLGVAREKQRIIKDWVLRKKTKK